MDVRITTSDNKIYQVNRAEEWYIENDVMTDASEFNVVLSNHDGAYSGLIRRFDRIEIIINEEVIISGLIDQVAYDSSQGGSKMRLSGRDDIGILIDNDALPITTSSFNTNKYITDKCDEYGIRSSIPTSLPSTPRLIVGTGESEISVINNLALFHEKSVIFDNDTLIVDDLDMNADPTYLFSYATGIGIKDAIPLKRTEIVEDGLQLASEIIIHGSINGGKTKAQGTATNPALTSINIKKRKTIRSSNNDSVSKYSASALDQVQRKFREGIKITSYIFDTEYAIKPNRTARLIDLTHKINSVFYISSVRYQKSINEGSIIIINMIPADVSFNVMWSSNNTSVVQPETKSLEELLATRK